MIVYLSRWVCEDYKKNLEKLKEEAKVCKEKKANIVIFPEIFLHGYKQNFSEKEIEETFEKISEEFKEIIWVFGSYVKGNKNRLSVWKNGREIAYYNKIHLFKPNNEHKIWEKGDFYSALNFNNLKIGFLICNDIRFPEAARSLKIKFGIDLLIVVAWWPLRRDHIWKTLLQARAIENGVWVLGCCISGCNYKDEIFHGALNYVFAPDGSQVLTGDDLTYEILNKKIEILVDPLKEYLKINELKLFYSD